MLIWLIYLFLPMLLSYGLYPLMLYLFVKLSKQTSPIINLDQPTFDIYILTALHNEEKVIAKKLQSILDSQYPRQRIFPIFGLDACTDQSATIIEQFREKMPNIQVVNFPQRSGKPFIINTLQKMVPEHALIFLTDANVFPDAAALGILAKNFQDPTVMLVDATFRNPEHKKDDAIFEQDYNSYEQCIKSWESNLNGTLMGPSGGGYMIRATAFTRVPDNFLVDDFFIGLNCFKNGGRCLLDKDAICYESVNGTLADEFKRKRRIAAGNFQNLAYFLRHHELLSAKQWICFFFHKILRWIHPIWVCFHLFFYIFLTEASRMTALFIIILIFINALLNMVFSKVHLYWKPVKSVHYFIIMNMGLLWGFFDYLKGIKSNVWQPTPRN